MARARSNQAKIMGILREMGGGIVSREEKGRFQVQCECVMGKEMDERALLLYCINDSRCSVWSKMQSGRTIIDFEYNDDYNNKYRECYIKEWFYEGTD